MPYKDPEVRKAKAKEYSRASYLRNRDELLAYRRNKYATDPTTQEWHRQWRKQRLARHRELQAKYRAEGRLTKVKREYATEQRRTNPQFRIASSLRARAGAVLRGTNKSASSRDLVGCEWWHLRLHIEAQWLEGMTWENYGRHGWHIDHIVPLKSFDLTDPGQQRAAFHYTNLQPLWATENLRKGAKCRFGS